MMGYFRLLRKLFWKEKRWIIITILQIYMLAFILPFASYSLMESYEIIKTAIVDVQEDIFYFASIQKEEINEEELDNKLSYWIDKERVLASYFYMPIDNEIGVFIGVGDRAKDLFPKEDFENGVCYCVSKDLTEFIGKEIEVNSPMSIVKEAKFLVEKSNDEIPYLVIGEGSYDMKKNFLLFLTYEQCDELFSAYATGDIVSNLLFFSNEKQQIKLFQQQMSEVGFECYEINYKDYINEYFGANAISGLLFQIFFLMVGYFILYNIYIRTIQLIEIYRKEFSVYYLCGEQKSRICIQLISLVISTVPLGFIVSIYQYMEGGFFQNSKFINSFIGTLAITIIAFMFIIVKIIHIFSAKNMEQYWKMKE